MSNILPYEKELLLQLTIGDEKAFGKIYEFYQARIFLFAFRFTKSKAAAEEIVQEVFVKLWINRENIKIEKQFGSYIIRITKNLIIDRLKKASLDKIIQQKIYEDMQALRNSSVDLLIEKEISRLHKQAIDLLSPQKKTIYLLSREEQLSYEQIAQKLGLSKNTVRNHMSEALQTIRDFISSHPDIACIFLATFLSGTK